MNGKLLVKIAALLLATVFIYSCGEADASQTNATMGAQIPSEIYGSALPDFESTANDLAIGQISPAFSGTDIITGEWVSTGRSIDEGRPLIIGFYAHWCLHCQSEVPIVVEGLKETPLPDGVNFISVSIFEDSTRGNHPADAWLKREGWSYPVISDTRGGAIAETFGVSATPFMVLVDSEGKINSRIPGQVGPELLVELANQLLALANN